MYGKENRADKAERKQLVVTKAGRFVVIFLVISQVNKFCVVLPNALLFAKREESSTRH